MGKVRISDRENRNAGQILMFAKCPGSGLNPYYQLEVADIFDPLVAVAINLAVNLQRQILASGIGGL